MHILIESRFIVASGSVFLIGSEKLRPEWRWRYRSRSL